MTSSKKLINYLGRKFRKGHQIAKYPILKFILDRKNFRIQDSIIIFSEPRGGSTWLMEILHYTLNAGINFEPLHAQKGVVPEKYRWGLKPYIKKDNSNPNFQKLTEDILTLSVYNRWTTKYLSVKDTLTCQYVITKFVRANLMIPYILKTIPLKFPPIILLRHPIDCALSQIKIFDKNDRRRPYSIFKNAINSHRFTEHEAFIKSLNTRLEEKVALWCINNLLMIKRLKHFDKKVLVFYEDLVQKPEQELQRTLETLGVEYQKEAISQFDFNKKSQSVKKDVEYDPEHQLYKNLKNLSSKEKDCIQEIFNYFDFSLYNAFSPYANKQVVGVGN